ncbi:hypothetical protein Nepgr_016331 [Nepenthes gracilis]|uniref:Uncharacterized protein n=1 Tax=Nepenthes gracilis TaxID=150966 RepID=A0AAD3XSE5_NEPGR|nr:hypothetical protein Nepgr_016331 [Nepenthes gracilis]
MLDLSNPKPAKSCEQFNGTQDLEQVGGDEFFNYDSMDSNEESDHIASGAIVVEAMEAKDNEAMGGDDPQA